MTPLFLSLSDILEIHADQVVRYGGAEEVRDMERLQSCVAAPEAGFGDECFHAFPFEMAAAYLYHIVHGHPFLDGNKRTGTVAALVFLDVNGIEVDIPSDKLVAHVLAVAAGELGKAETAVFLAHYALK